MRILLNIIWLVLSGLWLAIGYALAGLVMQREFALLCAAMRSMAIDRGGRI